MTAQPARERWKTKKVPRIIIARSKSSRKSVATLDRGRLPNFDEDADIITGPSTTQETGPVRLPRPSTPPRPIIPTMPATPSKPNQYAEASIAESIDGIAPRGVSNENDEGPRSSRKDDWQSYLCQSSFAGDFAIVQSLLQMGISMSFHDYYGYSPIHYAAGGGHEDILRLFAESGANLDQSSVSGLTALHIVAGRGQLDVASVLVGRSATPMGSARIIRTLIELGADPNVTDFNDQTPLHIAVTQQWSSDAVRALLEGGANPKARTWQGDDVLHTALLSLAPQVFLDDQLDLDIDDIASSTLNDAADDAEIQSDKYAVVDMLIDAGADVTSTNATHNTPLELAISVGARDRLIEKLNDA